MTVLQVCLAAGYAAGICHTLLPSDIPPPAPPPLPAWATSRWVYDAAGIVAGETVPHCAECDLWIACTVMRDVAERNYHPWRLRPGRWHGWREPREQHLEAVEGALEAGGCLGVPTCAYLGSLSDYAGNWRFGLAHERQVLVIGNRYGAIVCIPSDDD